MSTDNPNQGGIIPLVNQESKSLEIDWEDEIITGCLVVRDGAVVHPSFTGNGAGPPATAGAGAGASASAPASSDAGGEARQ